MFLGEETPTSGHVTDCVLGLLIHHVARQRRNEAANHLRYWDITGLTLETDVRWEQDAHTLFIQRSQELEGKELGP